MFYIEETEKEIIKYEVKLNTEKLTKLRKKIIDECSEIIHYHYETDYEPRRFKNKESEIRNYRSIATGKVKEYFEETRDIYEVEYDEYKYTPLVEYIDRLLKGDTSVIKLLRQYIPSSNPIDQIRQQEATVKYNIISYLKKPIEEININFLKRNIDTLSSLKDDIELNKNQKGDFIYYEDIISCIVLIKIDSINKDVVSKVEDFYGKSYTKK